MQTHSRNLKRTPAGMKSFSDTHPERLSGLSFSPRPLPSGARGEESNTFNECVYPCPGAIPGPRTFSPVGNCSSAGKKFLQRGPGSVRLLLTDHAISVCDPFERLKRERMS